MIKNTLLLYCLGMLTAAISAILPHMFCCDPAFAATAEPAALVASSDPPKAILDRQSFALDTGGSALIRFKASKELSDAILSAGDLHFPLFSYAGGEYAALITIPYNANLASFNLSLRLTDRFGNSTRANIPVHKRQTALHEDEITIFRSLLEDKASEFSAVIAGESDPLTLYLRMNTEERSRNYKKIEELCRAPHPAPLWRGAFISMPGAVRRSNFADQRRYVYNGTVIDRQVHLGIDYASIAKDRIPAANFGRVIYSGYLGIHGNMVLIDHGMGLCSLYSHLSEIFVLTGQDVHKGEIIGLTGTTGMAGGDHLHFEMLVNGISVNPLPWCDPNWVEDNINARLP